MHVGHFYPPKLFSILFFPSSISAALHQRLCVFLCHSVSVSVFVTANVPLSLTVCLYLLHLSVCLSLYFFLFLSLPFSDSLYLFLSVCQNLFLFSLIASLSEPFYLPEDFILSTLPCYKHYIFTFLQRNNPFTDLVTTDLVWIERFPHLLRPMSVRLMRHSGRAESLRER